MDSLEEVKEWAGESGGTEVMAPEGVREGTLMAGVEDGLDLDSRGFKDFLGDRDELKEDILSPDLQFDSSPFLDMTEGDDLLKSFGRLAGGGVGVNSGDSLNLDEMTGSVERGTGEGGEMGSSNFPTGLSSAILTGAPLLSCSS